VTHTVQAFRRKYDTTLHTQLLALFIPLHFRCHPLMKEIEQAAAVLGGSPQTVDRIILPCSTFTLKELDVNAVIAISFIGV